MPLPTSGSTPYRHGEMHEFPITKSILDLALRHAEAAGAARIRDLYLVVGELSSVVDESVRFYWDMVSRGTRAEGARLHFRCVPVRWLCLDCGEEFPLSPELPACPRCHSGSVRLAKGQEFYLEAIDVEPGCPEPDPVGGTAEPAHPGP
jgi:hydrogenase nickel incorporation protein HypA/HybF